MKRSVGVGKGWEEVREGKEYKRDDKGVEIDIKKGMKGTERMTVKSKRDKGIEEEDVRG